MRKRVVFWAGLLILAIIGGGLYTTLARPDTQDTTVLGYMVQNPYDDFAMPSIVIDPATDYCSLVRVF
jgi:hypothetical protein